MSTIWQDQKYKEMIENQNPTTDGSVGFWVLQ